MKTLQNNFTTPEQSKKLLELGVPADTADCYYEAIGFNNGYESVPQICSNVNFGINVIDLPCWSVGRLIEIYCIINGQYIMIHGGYPLIPVLVNAFEAETDLDFSKLED